MTLEKKARAILTTAIFSLMFVAFTGIGNAYAIQTSDDVQQLDIPKTQTKVAEKYLPILEQIDKTEDLETRQALEAQLEPAIGEMLQAGLVPTIWYEEDPQHWNDQRSLALAEKDFKYQPVAYNFVSSSSYKIELYHSFWCYLGLYNCSTTPAVKNTELPYSLSSYTKLPDHAWHGNLENHHKITKNSAGGETIDTDNYGNSSSF